MSTDAQQQHHHHHTQMNHFFKRLQTSLPNAHSFRYLIETVTLLPCPAEAYIMNKLDTKLTYNRNV